MNKPALRVVAAVALVGLAVAWRIINWKYSIAPNLEFVTAASLVAAAFLGTRAAVAVPLGAMAISDIVIGNSNILFFTWSAFALIGLAGLVLRRFSTSLPKLLGAGLVGGVGASLFFFAFTNFGVWLLGGLYTPTFAGLMQSYEMGLPFYRTMLAGNLVLVPLALGAAYLVRKAVTARSSVTASAPAEA